MPLTDIDGQRLGDSVADKLGNRNLITNGAMQVAQRGTSAIQIGTGTYNLDRFRGYDNTDGTFTVQQVTDAPSGFGYSAKVTVTAADSSLASTQQAKFQQRIEGNVLTQLKLGTSAAETFTLSFYVKSSVTGTYAVGFINASNNRSYVGTYSISSANTWEYKTITVQGDTSGTWATNNTTGLNIQWSLGMGSSFEAAPDQWHASEESHTTSAVDLISTLNATWQITGIQLEVGNTATPFEHKRFSDELQHCQRYYEKSYNYSTVAGTASDTGKLAHRKNSASSGITDFTVSFSVRKRDNPTLVVYSPDTGAASRLYNETDDSDVQASGEDIGETGGHITSTISIGGSKYLSMHYSAEAEL